MGIICFYTYFVKNITNLLLMNESINPKSFNTTYHNFGKYEFGSENLTIKNLDSKTPIM